MTIAKGWVLEQQGQAGRQGKPGGVQNPGMAPKGRNPTSKIKKNHTQKTIEERIEMDKEMNIQLNRLEEQDDNNNPEREFVGLGVTEYLKKRNMVDISGTALRYDASSCLAGALATAFLGDLIKAGVLPAEATSLSVD